VRIAFDATAIPPNRAGAGVYIYSLVKALAAIDSENQYLIFAKTEHIQEFQITQPNFEFVSVPNYTVLRRMAWEQTALPGEVWRRKIDLLHSPHYTMPFAPPCRTIVTFHDMTFFSMPELHGRGRRLFFPAVMRQSSRRADRLISVSESTRQDMIRLLELPPKKIAVTPLAASQVFRVPPAAEVADVCKRYGLIPGRFLLYVGVLEPRKNVPHLLEAYSRIAQRFPDVPLVIAGKKGWMYEAIFERVSSLKLESRVHFPGYVAEEDLPGLYHGARAFVYPSRYEGFGLPVLEAMQCGVPVITSNISSMPEVAGDAALLVSPDDTAALTDAIARLMTDDELAHKLAQRGLVQAKRFTWERCARETLSVYHSCLQEQT